MRLVLDPSDLRRPALDRAGAAPCPHFLRYLPAGWQPFPRRPARDAQTHAGTGSEQRGWTFNVGPEPEFFLFKRNGPQMIHPVPHDVGRYFDFSANDEAVRVRTELMDALAGMGLEVEMGHHEVALGQHEIDFRFADALQTADNVLTLKYTVKAIAAQHDLVASFMPKPIFGINGSGMHCHQSLFDADGRQPVLQRQRPVQPVATGLWLHCRAAAPCPRPGSRGRADGQFLQAAGARL